MKYFFIFFGGFRINKKAFLCCFLILTVVGITFSAVAAHPGHGEYTPEEVVSPSESSSPASSSESSSYSPAESTSSSSSEAVSSSSSSGGSSYSQSSGAQSGSSSGSSQSSSGSDGANSQSGSDGHAVSNTDTSKNDTIKKNNTTVNNTGDIDSPKENNNLLSFNNIIYLIIAFFIGFGLMVLLHKFKVI